MSTAAKVRWEDHARQELRRAGARTGGAREAVIAQLEAQRCCLSAQDLFDQLRAGRRTVGLASVYRALDQLADMKLVHRIDFGDGVARFEPAHPGGEHHHHLICSSCGELVPFDDPELEQTMDSLGDRLPFTVDAHEVVLRGTCERCAHS